MPWTSSSMRGVDDSVDGAVVAEVDHLGALRLEQPPDDVDRGVVAVEEAGRGDEAYSFLHHGGAFRFFHVSL